MAGAKGLMEKIARDLHPLEKKIREHPYLDALEGGKVKREALRFFVGEQLNIIPWDLRSIALLVSRCERPESQQFFNNVLQGEVAALEAVSVLADAVGMTPDDRATFEPSPGAQGYSAYLAWLCLYGSDAQVTAALSVNFAAWGANCRRMAGALKERYSFQDSDIRFFTQFAEAPTEVSPEAMEIIEAGIARGITQREIARACRMLQGYELMFWDTVFENTFRGTGG